MLTKVEELGSLVFSYFFIDIEVLKKWSREFFALDNRGEKYHIEEGPLDLQIVRLGRPCSGGAEKIRAVIFSPKSLPSHCVFVSNYGDGWYTLINCICSDLGAKCISVSSTQDEVEFPINSLRVYEKTQVVRYVRAMLDGDRWDFFEKGTVQPFEVDAHYKKRRIKDRLSRTIIIDYLKKLDIDILESEFWETDSPALFISEQRP